MTHVDGTIDVYLNFMVISPLASTNNPMTETRKWKYKFE